MALCFINVNDQPWEGELTISAKQIVKLLGRKMGNAEQFADAKAFAVTDLWSGETTQNTTGDFTVAKLAGCENVTLRVKAL